MRVTLSFDSSCVEPEAQKVTTSIKVAHEVKGAVLLEGLVGEMRIVKLIPLSLRSSITSLVDLLRENTEMIENVNL